MGETAIPATEPSFVLLRNGDHKVHELDMRTRPRGRSAPGRLSGFTVVDSIDDDIMTEPQILFRHRTRCLVCGNADLPPWRQTAGKDRLLGLVDGQVDRPRACSDDLGNARLSDSGETGERDESTGHATFSGVMAAICSATRSSASSSS